jgi:sulfate adenylyltransferase
MAPPPVPRTAPPPRIAEPAEAASLAARAARLPSVALDPAALADLELVATGAAAPLGGFLGRLDHRSVLDRWRLASGEAWPWPLTLAVPVERLAELAPGSEVALRDEAGALRGVLAVSDAYVRSPREEARVLFGGENPAHPGIAEVLRRPPGTLGGEVLALPLPPGRPAAASAPAALGRAAAERGWRRTAALQTLGAPTRAQHQAIGVALGMADGVVVQPMPEDGEPAGPRGAALLEAWRAAVARFPRDRILVAPPPVRDRRAGGREVLLQAFARRAAGASAFLVVREGDLLRPGDGLPADLSAEEIGIAIVPFAAEFALPDGDALAAVA